MKHLEILDGAKYYFNLDNYSSLTDMNLLIKELNEEDNKDKYEYKIIQNGMLTTITIMKKTNV